MPEDVSNHPPCRGRGGEVGGGRGGRFSLSQIIQRPSEKLLERIEGVQ